MQYRWQRSQILKAAAITVVTAIVAIIAFIGINLSGPNSFSGTIESPDKLAAPEYNPNGGTVIHPYLGFVFDPAQNPGVNKFGFYGPDPIVKRVPDKLIVGLFGGSVAGFLSRWETDNLIRRLEALPQFSGRKVEIINVSGGGSKQPQQLIGLNYLQSLGAEFDIVVNIDGFNEAALSWAENVPRQISSFFPRTWSFYARQGLDLQSIELAASLQKDKNQLARIDNLFSSGLLSNFGFIRNYFRSRELKQISEDNDALTKLLNSKPSTYAMTGPEPERYTPEEIKNNIVGVWKNSSVQMSKIVEANHGLYLHFLQPNQYLPGSKTLTPEEKKDAYMEESDYGKAVRLFYPEMIKEGAALKKEGVIFIDLTSLFKNSAETIYNDTCCHYNKHGNDILAEKIAETIAENYK